MSNVSDGEKLNLAKRELNREHMSSYGGGVAWLKDPSVIPDRIADDANIGSEPHERTAFWMTMDLADWVERTHGKLSYQETFDRHELSGPGRVKVRSTLREQAINMYAPGIRAMSEIFSVIPVLALREGIDDPNAWLQFADKARDFGAAIARDGTRTQAVLRIMLGLRNDVSQSGVVNLKLDNDTGVTSKLDLPILITGVSRQIAEIAPRASDGHICTALQAKVPGLGGKTMFDACWDSYAAFAERSLYRRAVATEIDTSVEPFKDVSAALEHSRSVVVQEYGHEASTSAAAFIPKIILPPWPVY